MLVKYCSSRCAEETPFPKLYEPQNYYNNKTRMYDREMHLIANNPPVVILYKVEN